MSFLRNTRRWSNHNVFHLIFLLRKFSMSQFGFFFTFFDLANAVSRCPQPSSTLLLGVTHMHPSEWQKSKSEIARNGSVVACCNCSAHENSARCATMRWPRSLRARCPSGNTRNFIFQKWKKILEVLPPRSVRESFYLAIQEILYSKNENRVVHIIAAQWTEKFCLDSLVDGIGS